MYTIYESIGRSVVVPYCGSKTINVRLTVSPDAKTANIQHADAANSNTTAPPPKGAAVFSRKYRYKSRKLVPAVPDDSDVADRIPPLTTSHAMGKFKCQLTDDLKKELLPNCCSGDTIETSGFQCPTSTPIKTGENHYEIVQDVIKLSATKSPAIVAALQRLEEEATVAPAVDDLAAGNYSCRECSSQCPLIDVSIAPVHKPRKLMRKSRSKKQKTPKSSHARVRSLSVGNENCLRNNHQAIVEVGAAVVADKINSVGGGEECLNNLRRNDLIDIIRESMEKNRLCFQSNG